MCITFWMFLAFNWIENESGMVFLVFYFEQHPSIHPSTQHTCLFTQNAKETKQFKTIDVCQMYSTYTTVLGKTEND